MTTFAPAPASARTTALPIPLLPPVTMATFPLSPSLDIGLPPLRRCRMNRVERLSASSRDPSRVVNPVVVQPCTIEDGNQLFQLGRVGEVSVFGCEMLDA